ARVESGADMAAVRADDGEALREGGFGPGRLSADRLLQSAVEAAAALEQETAVPVVRHVDREADRVVAAVDARAVLEAADDMAMRRQGPRRGRAAAAHGSIGGVRCFRDLEIVGTVGPFAERVARRLLRLRSEAGEAEAGQRQGLKRFHVAFLQS